MSQNADVTPGPALSNDLILTSVFAPQNFDISHQPERNLLIAIDGVVFRGKFRDSRASLFPHRNAIRQIVAGKLSSVMSESLLVF